VNNCGICLILSAPSGGGKTTIIRALMEMFPNLRHSISYTTRQPREDKSDITDYHFIDEKKFRAMVEAEEFLEWAEVHSFLYGTRRRDLETLLGHGYDVVLDIDIQGAARMRNVFPAAVHIFIMPPSLETLEQRLRDRESESERSIQKRLENAHKELDAFQSFDYLVINDEFEKTIDQIRSILIAERCKTNRFSFARKK
jgi:guanylate kinase